MQGEGLEEEELSMEGEEDSAGDGEGMAGFEEHPG
jgi:hypothetical protein